MNSVMRSYEAIHGEPLRSTVFNLFVSYHCIQPFFYGNETGVRKIASHFIFTTATIRVDWEKVTTPKPPSGFPDPNKKFKIVSPLILPRC